PLMTAPLGSFTDPRISPVICWAAAIPDIMKPSSIATQKESLRLIVFSCSLLQLACGCWSGERGGSLKPLRHKDHAPGYPLLPIAGALRTSNQRFPLKFRAEPI